MITATAARVRAEREADRARLRTGVLHRLAWARSGTTAEDIDRSMGQRFGAAGMLRALAADGLAVEAGGRWFAPERAPTETTTTNETPTETQQEAAMQFVDHGYTHVPDDEPPDSADEPVEPVAELLSIAAPTGRERLRALVNRPPARERLLALVAEEPGLSTPALCERLSIVPGRLRQLAELLGLDGVRDGRGGRGHPTRWYPPSSTIPEKTMADTTPVEPLEAPAPVEATPTGPSVQDPSPRVLDVEPMGSAGDLAVVSRMLDRLAVPADASLAWRIGWLEGRSAAVIGRGEDCRG